MAEYAKFFKASVSRATPVPDKSYNVAPQSHVPVLINENGRKLVAGYYWWLTPAWAVEGKTGAVVEFYNDPKNRKKARFKGKMYSMFNIRRDTITDPAKPYWKHILHSRRCCILADGFYEWPDPPPKDKPKLPGYFTLADGRQMALAGVYEIVKDDEGNPFYSCAIITTDPNDLLKNLPHHRMPVILEGADLDNWLDPEYKGDLTEILKPYDANKMKWVQVSQKVNSPKNKGPECIEPLNSGD